MAVQFWKRIEIEAKIRAVAAHFDLKHPAGNHRHDPIEADRFGGPNGPNWRVQTWSTGDAYLQAFTKEVQRVRSQMPMVDPADL